VSIYVNPTQFGPNEDLAKYPRPIEEDVRKLQQIQTNALFLPETLYANQHSTWVNIDTINAQSEAVARPGHFRGVATVVTKLLNLVQPTDLFMGQKDAIQCSVIHTLISDLNIPVKLHIVPTTREADGVAMSSRNRYLSSEQRQIAPLLYRALCAALEVYNSGGDVQQTKRTLQSFIANSPHSNDVTLEYVNVTDQLSGALLNSFSDSSSNAVLSAVMRIGTTRLLDNIVLPARV